MPKCPKEGCTGMTFIMKEFTPINSRFKYNAICCFVCDSIVGVVEYYNVGAEVVSLKDTISKIAEKVKADY